MDPKAFLRHELLNIFTMLLFFSEQEDLSEDERREMQKLLHRGTLLVKYEDVFLGKDPRFFKRTWDFTEALREMETVFPALKLVTAALSPQRFFLSTDQDAFLWALRSVLEYLNALPFPLNMRWEKRECALVMTSIDERRDFPPVRSLEECFEKEELESGELQYQLALYLLAKLGTSFRYEGGEMVISLRELLSKED